MNNFIILSRIGKNSQYYLLWILNIDTSRTDFVIYDREKEIIVDKEILISEFHNYETDEIFEEFDLETFDTDIKDYCFFRFNYETPPKLRAIHYTVKRKDSKQVFVPCCGRHPDHDNIKEFSKYTDSYEIFEDVYIEGYIIKDQDKFDTYITKLDVDNIILDFRSDKNVLFRELRDCISDHFQKSYKNITFKMIDDSSGEELIIKL